MGKAQRILEELIGSKPEQLTGEAKRLFEAIMKIADERDELLEKNKEYEKQLDLDYVNNNFISKDKIKAKIEEFKQVRDEILREEKEFNRPMMTYDLKRNDYCEKMLQSLLEEEE